MVDTSVWVAALRDERSREARALNVLLDADEVGLAILARIELLTGASRTDRRKLRRGLSALPVLYPTDATWSIVDSWVDRAADAGERFGVVDLLIGALASETGSLVWSLDADFLRMQRLRLIDLYQP